MSHVAQEHLPTVAELRAMSDAELEGRHDAAVDRAQETGAPFSDIYLSELGRRMVELRAERTMRIALIALIASAAAIVVTLIVLIVAL
jgi:hypothetical protein